MYVYMYVYIYTYILYTKYIRTHISLYISVCIRTHMCMTDICIFFFNFFLESDRSFSKIELFDPSAVCSWDQHLNT